MENKAKKPLVLGHRGYSGLYPENTPLAFRKVAEVPGADGIETDVHICRSGELVLCHDEAVDRTSNGHGLIRDMSYDELMALDFGSWKSPEFAGEHIWTLPELLDFCKETGLILNLELKNGIEFYPHLEERCLHEISIRHMEDQVFLSSFNHISMQRFKELCGDRLETGLLYEAPLLDMEHYLERSNADNVHPCFHVFDYQPELMEMFHSRGMKVNVWTVNTEEDARKLIRLGVDGMIGNYPDRLVRAVESLCAAVP